MVLFFSAVFGAVLGGITAKRRGGNRLDIAQYAAGFAIAFAILGMFATLAFLNTTA
ncbi:MAG: apolipoprotein acyltransferase [Paracoccaceae bacterium]